MISRAIDDDDYFVLGSLDLSAAFDVVNRDLLFKRLGIMGIPDDLRGLLRDWLDERKCYVEVGEQVSAFFDCNHGTLQGSVLGPVLFCLFIRPLYDIEDLITYADDNYFGESDADMDVATRKLVTRMEIAIRWLTMSGLKINTAKTELCIFHRRNVLVSLETFKVKCKKMFLNSNE